MASSALGVVVPVGLALDFNGAGAMLWCARLFAGVLGECGVLGGCGVLAAVLPPPLTLLYPTAGCAGGEGAAEIPPGDRHVALCHRPVRRRPQRCVPRLPHWQRHRDHRNLPEPPLHRDLRHQPERLPSASVLRGKGRVPTDRVLRCSTLNWLIANVFSPISLMWQVSAGFLTIS